MNETEGSNRSRRGSAALADARSTPLDRLAATPIEIGGEVFRIGELGVDETIVIARLLGEASVRMSATQRDALRELIDKADSREIASQKANLLAFLQLLEPLLLRRMFGALLDRPEDWVKQHLKLRHALHVIETLLEHNDLDELKSHFFGVTKHFGASLGNSPPRSPSSPPTESRRPKPGGTPSGGSAR